MVFNKLGGILLEYMNIYIYDICTVYCTYVYSYPQKEEERLETDANSISARKLPEEPCAFSKGLRDNENPQGQKPKGRRGAGQAVSSKPLRSIERYCY